MILIIDGADAKSFVERQASNNLTKSFNYTAFLKPKGQLVALAAFSLDNDQVKIFTKDTALLKEHLEKFAIVEDLNFKLEDEDLDIELDSFDYDQSIIKLEETSPGILAKYVSFTKGCFPGQEVLSKYKNIGLKKKEERSKKYTDEALEIFAQAQNNLDDLEPAVELLRKALKENPKNEDAYESLGVMLAKQEKFQEAIAVMQQLEMINPKNQMALMNLSIFYMKIGDKETAEDYKAKGTVLQFEKALET